MSVDTNSIRITDQVKESLSLSTVKGIPRIMKTKNKCIRSLWIMATVLVVFLACGHSYFLFKGFLQYSVFTITEESFDLTLDSMYFPSITICSLVPFPENVKMEIPTYESFYEKVNEKLKELKMNGTYLDPDEEALIKNVNMYYEWLTLEKAKFKGYEEDVLILKCRIMLSGRKATRASCKNYLKVTLVQNPDLFNCYTLTFTLSKYSGNFIEKVTLNLFLGNISSDYSFYAQQNKELIGQGK